MSEVYHLNEQQQQAVNAVNGPVLVVAGAGTGKTRVIVERIQNLIQGGVEPRHILALTFTEKAAAEMFDRVSAASLGAALDTTIATFNSFGNDLLTAYGSEWGLGTQRLLGDTGQLVFLREHFDELALDYFAPISNPDGQLVALSEYVSALKQQLVQPEAYLTYADTLPVSDQADQLEKTKHQELARFYKIYLGLCRAHSVIDYDDQLFLTIQLLRARPNVLKKLQQQYQYVLVDEFQDTNPMQSALVDLLVGERQNLMVVGDDDQSIYGWRGATLANILDFKKRYPTARDITLIENYRSSQSILDAAYRLIQNNNPERLEVMNKLDKRLHGQTNDGPGPLARHFYTFEAELTWIAENIAWRVQNGEDPGSIAVLARGRQAVDRMHEALELHGVVHAVAGKQNNIYRQPAVRQLIEVLKAVADPLDDVALFHALSGPVFVVPYGELAAAMSTSKKTHERLQDIIAAAEPTSAATQALATITAWREASANASVGSLAYTILTDSNWKTRLYEQSQTDAESYTSVQAISSFFKTLKEFERIAGVPSVQNYLVNLPTLEADGTGFEDASLSISDSLVNVMTVHASKGLEWDAVFVIDCLEQAFPFLGGGKSLEVPAELRAVASSADARIAEERRLMYVAITRARRELILSYSDKHGSGAHRKPSRFLAEMFEQDTTAETVAHEDQASLELFATQASSEAISLPSDMLQNDIITVTASQIECWLDCPQDFYYKHVLKMPEPDSPAAAYGTIVHKVIQQLSLGRQNGAVPTLDDVLAEVTQQLPKTGYATPGIRSRAHAQALNSIKNIYERFTTEQPTPIEIEKPFGVMVPNIPLTIIGRMDAVYPHEKGVEIRDYKTSSSVTTAEKAKTRATGSQQLTIYALAWQILHGELPALLSLDFVETGQLGSVRKTQRGIDTLVSKLAIMNEQLRAGQYPLGKDHTYCSHP